MFVSKRTRADFEEWRLEQEWTASKYAAWERGEKVLAPAKRTTAALREGRSQQEPSGDREADGNSGIGATRLAWSVPLRSSAHTRSFAAVRPRPSKAVDGIRTPCVGLDWAIRFPIGLPMDCGFQVQLAGSEMAEKIDVEVTGKSQFEVAYEMARFILTNMEGRQVKNIKRQELLHLVADCIEALRGIKVKEIIS